MSVLVIGRAQHVVAQVATAVRTHGFEVDGVTADNDAAARIAAGGVTALVIGGGVERDSRDRLSRLADEAGAAVINGRMWGRSIEGYVREDLVPELRRATAV